MYILLLTYQKPLEEVDKHLEAHKVYLEKNYKTGNFVASGRRNPRIGGVILCRAMGKKEVENLIKEDPFYAYEVAKYEILEFEPSKSAEGFEKFL
ncbi:YciI family protein [uncultured Bacteroides sp.]|uniref:YciI family protein n=1 Tax=uncultured Bacteroides sp. TaxID=162156 RepID=UPI002AAAED24|nr:YciI family protein [uncultured Bacteroides sp.]